MAQFCTCGSIIINDHCTNKNCTNRTTSAAAGKPAKTRTAKKGAKETNVVKNTRTRRASKCVTYNLYDLKNEEENAT